MCEGGASACPCRASAQSRMRELSAMKYGNPCSVARQMAASARSCPLSQEACAVYKAQVLFARFTPQKGNEIGPVVSRQHADIHPLARDKRFRVCEPAVEGGVRPDNWRGCECHRIGKIWYGPGLPSIDAAMQRAYTVGVERMTRHTAAFIELRTACGVPGSMDEA